MISNAHHCFCAARLFFDDALEAIGNMEGVSQNGKNDEKYPLYLRFLTFIEQYVDFIGFICYSQARKAGIMHGREQTDYEGRFG
ncbi:MAG TPA: hypothetical protein IAC60_04825 [Candidatus Enterosoma merdigallinarum]|nr:hypothetical protein [Candidatus Enterosoma merdigallinarum]